MGVLSKKVGTVGTLGTANEIKRLLRSTVGTVPMWEIGTRNTRSEQLSLSPPLIRILLTSESA